MPHVIEWYNKDDEKIAGEKVIPDIPASELKKVFPSIKDDPQFFHYFYDITKDHVEFLKHYVDINFQFEKFDYFLGYRAD